MRSPRIIISPITLGCWLFLAYTVDAFQHPRLHPSTPQTHLSAAAHNTNRRTLLKKAALAIGSTIQFTEWAVHPPESHAATFLPTTPEDLSEGNEFVRELRARSEANRERNLKKAQRPDKLSPEQFLGQYDKPKFVGIHRKDGTLKMVSPAELEELVSAGKVRVENEVGVTRDGKEYVNYSKNFNVFVDGEEQAPGVKSGEE